MVSQKQAHSFRAYIIVSLNQWGKTWTFLCVSDRVGFLCCTCSAGRERRKESKTMAWNATKIIKSRIKFWFVGMNSCYTWKNISVKWVPADYFQDSVI